MGIWERWKLGALALQLAGAVRDALRTIDGPALLAAVLKTVENEASDPRPGHGTAKWNILADWFVAAFPQHADRIDTLSGVVRALVAMLNAVGVFRKLKEV